jgi:hypothetical protein
MTKLGFMQRVEEACAMNRRDVLQAGHSTRGSTCAGVLGLGLGGGAFVANHQVNQRVDDFHEAARHLLAAAPLIILVPILRRLSATATTAASTWPPTGWSAPRRAAPRRAAPSSCIKSPRF